MDGMRVRVLIVAESPAGFLSISRRLEKYGCQCWYAPSYSDGTRMLAEQGFDLVLCSDAGKGVNALVTPLIGSSASLFRAHAVEDGCWWLPAVVHGERCLGTPALRPAEFAKELEFMVQKIRASSAETTALATR
jgi:hypothetical protein